MAEYPEFDPGVTHNEFKLFRKCEKCKLGDDEETDIPASAVYDFAKDHIRRSCRTCGFMWWERPKGA